MKKKIREEIERIPVLAMITITNLSLAILIAISVIVGETSVRLSLGWFLGMGIPLIIIYTIISLIIWGENLDYAYKSGLQEEKKFRNILYIYIFSVIFIIILIFLGALSINANIGCWPYIIIEIGVILITTEKIKAIVTPLNYFIDENQTMI